MCMGSVYAFVERIRSCYDGNAVNVNTLFFEAYDWLGVFSALFMLCYNGERGRGNAKLFYWFYPLHIYILYGLSVVVFVVM